ncbi:MAG: type II toxin-antitoxin system ParD family antitoxin [Parasphingopyxis sp.]|uniref:type II toxin-antitoxin system ParD family antitoxin n=1 Tax=Parasphingopyxis sp. TaxID=1920299 RepID=UPI002625E0DE|nr:type II toxin-antitoxin system ParD family antitoxin [uncultured Parasphingopyxis sp.]
MATMNISLPDEMKAHVEAQIATGRYANASDYIRSLVRRHQGDVDSLRTLIDEGEASGWSDRTPREAFAEAKKRFHSE